MEYKGYLIEEDLTGYAPKHLKFSFFNDDGETYFGSGESIEDCKQQINIMIMEKELDKGLNLSEASKKLGIARSTLYGLIDKKLISTFNFGLSKRIKEEEILRFLNNK